MNLLESERLRLRRVTTGDAVFIHELVNEPAFRRNIGDKGVHTLADACDYIRDGPIASYERYGFGMYIVSLKEDGAPIGICGLVKRDTLEDVDIGFAFLSRFWSRGYAIEAATAILEYARSVVRLDRVVGVTVPDNTSSIRLLEKLGLRFERTVRLAADAPELLLYASQLSGEGRVPAGRGLVVLDMAGTTIAATDHVPAAMIAAFGRAGLELEPAAMAAVRGRSKREAIRLFVERLAPGHPARETLSDAIFEDFRADLARRYASGVGEIPGALEAMRRLRSRGWAIALTTGFDQSLANLLLERLGWLSAVVDAVVTADDVPQGRPAPDLVLEAMKRTGTTSARDVVVVGDTAADLEAAANAGAGHAIGVLSGAHGREELVKHRHSAILDSIADLPAWLARQE